LTQVYVLGVYEKKIHNSNLNGVNFDPIEKQSKSLQFKNTMNLK